MDRSKKTPWLSMPYTQDMLWSEIESQGLPLDQLAFIDSRAEALERGGLTGKNQLLNRSEPGLGGVSDEYHGILDKEAFRARQMARPKSIQPYDYSYEEKSPIATFLAAERVKRFLRGVK